MYIYRSVERYLTAAEPPFPLLLARLPGLLPGSSSPDDITKAEAPPRLISSILHICLKVH